MKPNRILALETSCDDTSVAIVTEDRQVLCNLVASQDQAHAPFGGIVPEVASRNHSHYMLPLIEQALNASGSQWSDITGIAVTNRPGLVGSLIVGLVTAKTISLAKNIPFVGIHHIEGHIMAPFLWDQEFSGKDFYGEKFLALIVSGGHTQLYLVDGFGNYKTLGQTMDDAAGEAFDKFAKMVGLPYPGGVHVDKLSKTGDPKAFQFPRPLIKEENYSFSFSGLKSAAQRLLQSLSEDQQKKQLNDLCASYQAAIVDVLINRMERAHREYGIKNLVVSGGVSANSLLREKAEELAKVKGLTLAVPPLRYCTDNAAMIGLAGLFRLQIGENSPQDLAPMPKADL